jgi:SagB-type dehydrogenase family enzyme
LSASLILSLPADVAVAADGASGLVFENKISRLAFRRLDPALLGALELLVAPGEAEAQLIQTVQQAGGPDAIAWWYYHLGQLDQHRLLLRSVRVDGDPLATLVSSSRHFVYPGSTIVPTCKYGLSRFAYLRRQESGAVLESPTSHGRILLHDRRAVALIADLMQERPARELAGNVSGLSAEAGSLLLTLLLNAGMLQASNADGTPTLDEVLAQRGWEFQDLLFHGRIRGRGWDGATGDVSRVLTRADFLPALKPIATSAPIELARPDLEQLRREDLPFAEVQESRRSIREYADTPISARQLGEFLYRVARVKELRDVQIPHPTHPLKIELAPRPYPAGGGLHELDVYPIVGACDNIEPGMYHYDPLGHRLGRLAGLNAEVEQLLRYAGWGSGIPREKLQILFLLAARFERLNWKYTGIAYSLILKNVGVVYQTMYLAATAMGLAPCALGASDADLFARAAGTDYYADTSVGEFLLGSRRHDPAESVRKSKP